MSVRDLWGNLANKYAIHEETYQCGEQTQTLGCKYLERGATLQEARESYHLMFTSFADDTPFDGTVKELVVPSDTVAEGIPITVYKPLNCPKVPVIVIYFHGGGLVALSTEAYSKSVQMMSRTSGAVVVNVEYRLLPCLEDKFAPFNDAITVTQWVLKNKERVGGCADSKVGVAGDSAGGQIACSVTNEIRQLDFQVLIYPVTDLYCNLPSFEEFRDIPAFNTLEMEAMLKCFGFPISDVTDNPKFNPSARKDLELSPPTLMIFAELDPLIDWGKAYGQKLRVAGVEVEEMVVKGVPHGFYSLIQYFPTTCVPAHDRIANFINRFK